MLTVGIAGGTGSGKTTVVRKMISRFPKGHVAVIPQGGNTQVAINVLTSIIEKNLKQLNA